MLAPGDFLPLMDQLTFDPGDDTSQDCATVFIENDVILEDVERFSVILVTTDPDVSIRPDSAAVTITDDDSKCLPSPRNFLLTSCCILCFQV